MSGRLFEGIDKSSGADRGVHVVVIGPDASPEDVQAFRDAYELGCAWMAAEAALPEDLMLRLDGSIVRKGSLYYAEAIRDLAAIRQGHGYDVVHDASGPTPAAALRALVARLSASEEAAREP